MNTKPRRSITSLVGVTAALALVLAACDPGGTATTDSAAIDSSGGSTRSSPGVSGPERGGELRLIRGQSATTFDPDGALDNSDIQYVQHVLEPVLRYNPDGMTIDPGVVDEWGYDPDALTFSLHIRDGAKFSNGEPVTSDDIEFSVHTWQEGVNYGALYASIDSVEVVDESNVILHLAYPDSGLELYLTWQSAAVMPEDYAGMTHDEFVQAPIGAGPYVLESWTPGAEVVLARNEHFYDMERPYIDRIEIVENPDLNQRMLAMESGQADIADQIPPDQSGRVPEGELVAAPAHLMWFAALNNTRPPFDDAAVREAVAQAIDYEAIAALGAGTYVEPAGGIPMNVGGFEAPSQPWWATDVPAARQLMADSATPDGGPLELIYDTGLPNNDLMATVIQQSLEKIGFEVKVTGLESAGHTDRYFSLDYDISLWGMNAISPGAIDPVGYYLITDYLFTGHPVDQLEANFTGWSSTVDPVEQSAFMVAIQDEIHDQLPFVPLAFQQILTWVKPDVKGFEPSPFPIFWLDGMWLTK